MARDLLPKAAPLIAVCACLLQLSLVLGNLQCEELTADECAFAVSSSGSRCVLEKSLLGPSQQAFAECQTSSIIAGRPGGWIESSDCLKACGLDRQTYGLSTDALWEAGFVDKVCSADCQNSCPNIVDLYLKLAAGEGVYLPRLCMESRSKARRLISESLTKKDSRKIKKGKKASAGSYRSENLHHEHKNPDDSTDSSGSLGVKSSAALYAFGPSPSPSWAAKSAAQTGSDAVDSTKSSIGAAHVEDNSNSAETVVNDSLSEAVADAPAPQPYFEESKLRSTDDDDIYKGIEV